MNSYNFNNILHKQKKKRNIFKILFILITVSLLTSLFYIIKNLTLSITSNNEAINPNHVPYISTYYIKPVVSPDEEVILDFYVSDYDRQEYINEDFSEKFTITVKIDGKKDIVKKNLKAGDNTISLGTFNDLGEQKFSLIATDSYGRNSHELFNFFLVKQDTALNEYVMTEKDLEKCNIKNTDTYENKEIVTIKAEKPTKEIVEAILKKASSKITPKANSYTWIISDIVGNGEPGMW